MTKSPEEDATERTSEVPASEVENPVTGTEKVYDALSEESPGKDSDSGEPARLEDQKDTSKLPTETTNSEDDFSDSKQTLVNSEGIKEIGENTHGQAEEPVKAEDQGKETPTLPEEASNSEKDFGDSQQTVLNSEEGNRQEDLKEPVKPEDQTKDTPTVHVDSVEQEADFTDNQKETLSSEESKEVQDSQAVNRQDDSEDPVKAEEQRKDTPTPSVEPISSNDSQQDDVFEPEKNKSSMDGQGDEVVKDSRLENGKTDDAEPTSTVEDDRGGDSNPEQPATEGSAPQATINDHAENVPEGTEPEQDNNTQADGRDEAKTDNAPIENGSETLAVEAADTRPATQDGDYEDDFSEMSEKSDRAATQATAPLPTEGQEEAAPQPSKSPTPSGADEPRAEAGVVVPVPVPMKKSDGRSLAEERGETRGEDRSEVQVDGGEDSRGMGQWKSEEQLFLQSTLTDQQAEKEALQAVIDEKVKIQKEYDELKGRYVNMEEGSKQGELEKAMLREKCQQQEKRIQELQMEESRLKEFEEWGKDNEAKVKDLQERLASLAGEDAEKDRQVQKLQEELQETKARLIAAERQAALSSSASQSQPPPKSKTCTIL